VQKAQSEQAVAGAAYEEQLSYFRGMLEVSTGEREKLEQELQSLRKKEQAWDVDMQMLKDEAEVTRLTKLSLEADLVEAQRLNELKSTEMRYLMEAQSNEKTALHEELAVAGDKVQQMIIAIAQLLEKERELTVQVEATVLNE
jgi:hypothetical protein